MAGIDILNSLQDRGVDFGSSISVTSAATLDASALGKVIVCSGTSADYTVGLPAASESKGKRIVLLMDAGLTKLVTLDGNASETIDGALTQPCVYSEAIDLISDGTKWIKLSHKKQNLMAALRLGTSQLFATANTNYKVNVDTQKGAPTLASMLNTGSNRINIVRTGIYNVVATWLSNSNNASTSRLAASIYIDGSFAEESYSMYVGGSGERSSPLCTTNLRLSAGSYVEMWGAYYSAGSFATYTAFGSVVSYLQVTEL